MCVHMCIYVQVCVHCVFSGGGCCGAGGGAAGGGGSGSGGSSWTEVSW